MLQHIGQYVKLFCKCNYTLLAITLIKLIDWLIDWFVKLIDRLQFINIMPSQVYIGITFINSRHTDQYIDATRGTCYVVQQTC